MEFFRIKKDIPFMKYAVILNAISLLALLAAVFFLVTRGLHLSIEFTSGTLLEARYAQSVEVEHVQSVVDKLGYGEDIKVQRYDREGNVMEIRIPIRSQMVVQMQGYAAIEALQQQAPQTQLISAQLDNEQVVLKVSYPQELSVAQMRTQIAGRGYYQPEKVEIQVTSATGEAVIQLPLLQGGASQLQSDLIMRTLREADAGVTLQRAEYIGPQVGNELVNRGLLALGLVVAGVIIYLGVRFEWKFGVAGILANLHDVVIILGFFAFFQWEFSLSVLAATLAVLGYSVNESVVIFDRIREAFRRYRKMSTADVINHAITSTMSRTIITHGSTEAVVLCMFFFGGPTLHYFALALTIGILFGIYSSVFVAAALVMWFGVKREDFVKDNKAQRHDPNAEAVV